MSFEITQLSTFYSNNWKYRNVLGLSALAVLFPNELQQDGGAFKSIARMPVMTEVNSQDNWDQKTGFKEEDATEETVQVELTENWTFYTKIAKVNVPADWETWATGKMNIATRQEAKELDDFVLKQICTGVVNSIEGEDVTVDNIIDVIYSMRKEFLKHKARLEDTLILISTDVMKAIVKSNIEMGVTTIENTNAIVNRILNRYSVIEANVDDFGYSMVAVHPQAFAWISAIETPLQAGEYTQGPYTNQIFTLMNRFYGGKVLMPEHILGYKTQSSKIDIELSKTTSSVAIGGSDTVTINNKDSLVNASVKPTDATIATASLSNNTITITGVKAGSTQVMVSADNANDKSITVTVTAAEF